MKTKTRTVVPQPMASTGHRVTHVTGRRVTCSCGWATAGNVESQAAGQLIAEDHVRRVTG